MSCVKGPTFPVSEHLHFWCFSHTAVKQNCHVPCPAAPQTLETPGKQRLWSAQAAGEPAWGRKGCMQLLFCIDTSSSVQALSPVDSL